MSVGTTSPESARRSTAKYAKANPEKLRAKRIVEREKRAGRLKPPAACPACGRKVKLDFHHTGSYSAAKGGDGKDTKDAERKGLTGKWRCRRCHSSPERGKTRNRRDERSGKNMQEARRKAEATKKREGTYHKDGSHTK